MKGKTNVQDEQELQLSEPEEAGMMGRRWRQK